MYLATQIQELRDIVPVGIPLSKLENTDYLAMMYHEIGTPLAAIIGVSRILANVECSPQKKKECADVLNSSSNMLRELMSDMLDSAKLTNHSLELEHTAFNLVTLLEEVRGIISIKAAEKGLGVHTRIAKTSHSAFIGDPLRIRQILLNLLGNAVKFTDHGVISLYMTEKAGLNGRSEVRITVADHGIGIEKEQLGNIFGKYVQADSCINRKYGGTGLGLFISQQLAHLMDGTITVKSHLHKGSQFIVTLPLQKAPAPIAVI